MGSDRSPSVATLADDVELASRLLDVTHERELDELLGGLVRAAVPYGRAGSRPVRALVASLKRTAVTTVPGLTLVVRGERSDATSRIAAAATRTYGVELEGMSAEDRVFEIALRFARLARSATARLAGGYDAAAALTAAARQHAPGLLAPLQRPLDTATADLRNRKENQMFETETREYPQQVEYGEQEYGAGGRRGPWGQGMGGAGEYDRSEFSAGGYGEGPSFEDGGEYGEGPSFEDGGEYGEGPSFEDGGEYGEGPSFEDGGEYGEGPSLEDGGEYGGYAERDLEGQYEEGEEEGQGEEQFLPALAGLVPVVGKALGGLLGGGGGQLLGGLLGGFGGGGGGGRRRRRGGQGEFGAMEGRAESPQWEEEAGEGGEAEDQFLNEVFAEVLGPEREQDESVLTPAQEADFAARLLEVSNEEELSRILGGIVNTVGRAVQGIRGAVNSPQGRAVINAIKPLARAALPGLGGAIGGALLPGAGAPLGAALGRAASSLFEMETSGMSPEREDFETARRLVRLTAATAGNVAAAPPGVPPDLASEFGFFRASRRYAPPLYRRALWRTRPFARRYYGPRYSRFRGGYRYGRPYRSWGGYRGPRYWPGYGGPRPRSGHRRPPYWAYPPAVVVPGPAPEPEPAPEPGPEAPPPPGYRWVAVPIGAPAPTGAAPPAAPEPPGPGPEQGPPEPPPAQSEYRSNGHGGQQGADRSGRWVWRDGA